MARPKSFIPEEALEKAMHVFWDHGYEATSVQHLTEAMGINRFSLYDTFGDKHALFLQALDLYFNHVGASTMARIRDSAEDGAINAIERFLNMVVENAHDDEHNCRCLYQRAATELAPTDPEVRQRIERLFERLHDTYVEVLRLARTQGELAEGVRIPDAAWSLVILQAGITALDAAPPPARAGKGAIRAVLAPLRA